MLTRPDLGCGDLRASPTALRQLRTLSVLLYANAIELWREGRWSGLLRLGNTGVERGQDSSSERKCHELVAICPCN